MTVRDGGERESDRGR
jgi:hypothetical protein